MSKESITTISKFLSLVLRHQPEAAGVVPDENGWVEVSLLLAGMKERGWNIDSALLRQVVDTNNKKRFAFNEDRTKMRANQGHSINVSLGYTPQEPPSILYRGTTKKNLSSILSEGLQKKSRQHVHLSRDMETARSVGQRHGKPVVLTIASKEMHENGHQFYLSENGVWLTDNVPVSYLQVIGN